MKKTIFTLILSAMTIALCAQSPSGQFSGHGGAIFLLIFIGGIIYVAVTYNKPTKQSNKSTKQNKKELQALREVEEENDQLKLCEILKYEQSLNDVHFNALKKITDQSLLMELFKSLNKNNSYIASKMNKYIINGLTQSNLTDIAKNVNYHSLYREYAVNLLTDQSMLEYFATNGITSGERVAAISKLTNKSVLEDIAKYDVNFDIKVAAVVAMTKQKNLYDAIKVLRDFSILDDIGKHSSERINRRAAKIRLYLLKDKKKHCEEHKWIHFDCCLKQCTVCDVLEYNHNYICIGHSDNGFVTTWDYKCKICGSVAQESEGFTTCDTRQTGSVYL